MESENSRYKPSGVVEIPKVLIDRLQGLGPRFCLVKAHDKDPSIGGKGWQKPENLMYADDPRLQEHLRQGGNYGVVAGFGLAILNVDHDEIKSLVLEKFPKTFMWESPGHKAPVVLFLSNLEGKRYLRTKNGEYGGEILWEGFMAVGPGSIHPNGGVYKIINDAPLATIPKEQLAALLGDHLVPEKQVMQVEEIARSERKDSNVDLDILQVVPLAGLKKQGDEYFGPHPVHGSTTGRNFWVNPAKNVWYCFRHGTGGGPLLWLAVQEGIIRCEDAGPGVLRGDLFKQVLQKAVERGYIKEAQISVKKQEGAPRLGDYNLQLLGSNVVFLDKNGEAILSCKKGDLQEERFQKKLAERFNLPLEEVERACAQIALLRTEVEEGEKPREAVKVAGLASEGHYEAIYHEDKPAFLVYSNGQFKVLSEVHEGDVVVKPPTAEMCPYPPYRYYQGPVDTETLREEVFAEYNAFVDADTHYKHRWTTETFLSYQQEKLMAVPYEFLVGSEGSGKSQVGFLMKHLMYRALWGVSIPSADIYTYLSMHPCGSIIEDEIRGVERDVDKRKVYLAGYKQGALIPRIFDLPDGNRVIKYFPCFGFKFCADRKLVNDPAFMERFVVAHMLEGYPRKDEFTKQDIERLLTLRDKLLKWRMQNTDTPLPDVDPQVTGRPKELWKPLLQVGALIGIEKELRDALAIDYQEQRRKREETIEAAILKAMLSSLEGNDDEWIPAEKIWVKLTDSLEGSMDQKKIYLFHSNEFGEITKQLVGHRLRDGLGAEQRTVRKEGRLVKAWRLPVDKMLRLVRRYICYHVTDFTLSLEGNRVSLHLSCPYMKFSRGSSKQAVLGEKGGERAGFPVELKPVISCSNETVAPGGDCKIGNTVTVKVPEEKAGTSGTSGTESPLAGEEKKPSLDPAEETQRMELNGSEYIAPEGESVTSVTNITEIPPSDAVDREVGSVTSVTSVTEKPPSDVRVKHIASDGAETKKQENQASVVPTRQEQQALPVWLYRRIMSREECEVCGRRNVEYEIKDPETGKILRRCEQCYYSMRAKFTRAIWKNVEEGD